jgi:hypothetical protein
MIQLSFIDIPCSDVRHAGSFADDLPRWKRTINGDIYIPFPRDGVL